MTKETTREYFKGWVWGLMAGAVLGSVCIMFVIASSTGCFK